VEDYYNEAPSLVPFIRLEDENEQVWRDIQETVAKIKLGHHAEAIAAYLSMFERLRAKAALKKSLRDFCLNKRILTTFTST
jgi:DNA mismatch repair protein MutH